MGYRYAVIGSGRQGVAAAYDIAKFGEAEEVILVDINGEIAEAGARRINKLLNCRIATAIQSDAGNAEQLMSILDGVKSIISGVHFTFNIGITELAIRVGANMCDFGGNTGVVRKQIDRDGEAKAAGVTIVPDCGMGPGMNISLATYTMSLLDRAREVYIWDGGLPQEPKPPWNYVSTFSIDGLINEYYGSAYFLRDGKIVEVPCFDGFEELEFSPPLGRLEAFVTSGGLSTAPWTFEGRLECLENRTLRYPGHWAQFKAFAQLGLLGIEPVQVGETEVVPRNLFHSLLGTKITEPEVRDICVIRVKCIGEKDGRSAEAVVEVIDYYDEETGFTAMQRLTGWHASIIAILAAQGKLPHGVIPVELVVPGATIVEEARQRGLVIQEDIRLS